MYGKTLTRPPKHTTEEQTQEEGSHPPHRVNKAEPGGARVHSPVRGYDGADRFCTQGENAADTMNPE